MTNINTSAVKPSEGVVIDEEELLALLEENYILIVYGSGASIKCEVYMHAQSVPAIKSRLEKDRAKLGCLVTAKVFSHDDSSGNVFVDVETRECSYI